LRCWSAANGVTREGGGAGTLMLTIVPASVGGGGSAGEGAEA